MIQPKLDYCSQLWSPHDQHSINLIESVQRNFLSKVTGLEAVHHWDRLNSLGLYSQERRRERYMVIFLWKISENLVQGYDVSFENTGRRGRVAIPKPLVKTSPALVRRAREASLGHKGHK